MKANCLQTIFKNRLAIKIYRNILLLRVRTPTEGLFYVAQANDNKF